MNDNFLHEMKTVCRNIQFVVNIEIYKNKNFNNIN